MSPPAVRGVPPDGVRTLLSLRSGGGYLEQPVRCPELQLPLSERGGARAVLQKPKGCDRRSGIRKSERQPPACKVQPSCGVLAPARPSTSPIRRPAPWLYERRLERISHSAPSPTTMTDPQPRAQPLGSSKLNISA